MLSYVTGTVLSLNNNRLCLGVGTLGLEIYSPNAMSFVTGSTVSLHTYLHWNQEQGPSLYGFATEVDKTVFLMIIDCSGIGPKLGLSVLENLGAAAFLDAIQTNNEKALSKVSGIGGKKAEQLIVQLRDKVAKLIKSGVAIASADEFEQWSTVAQALSSLNYTRTEIAQAMKHLNETYTERHIPFDQLMRGALSYLARKS